MGLAEFLLGRGIDVRPHPHIGLATVTYLFRGETAHRDSLGTDLPIRPGEVDWMTGRGIAHSERTPQHLHNGTGELSASRPGWRCPGATPRGGRRPTFP